MLTNIAENPEIYYPLLIMFVFIMGACIGSFLNVCIWRIPRSESIVSPPSHCPKCDKLISMLENIPILSWLILRGKCSKCKEPISPRYILIEILTAILFTTIWVYLWHFFVPYGIIPFAAFIAISILTSALIVCVFVDIDHLIVPDSITTYISITGIIFSFCLPMLHSVNIHLPELYNMQAKIILPAINSMLSNVISGGKILNLLLSHKSQSLMDSILGMTFGYLMITSIIETGKLLWGRKKYYSPPDQMSVFSFLKDGVIIDDEKYEYEEAFSRISDKIILFSGTYSVLNSNVTLEFSDITIDHKHNIVIDGTLFNQENIDKLSGKLQTWSIPREVMGYGDAKFMAMVGAFMGPEAVFVILMMSSIIGALLGVLFVLAGKKELYSQIPFVPYLATSTYLWIILSFNISNIYKKFLFL